MTQPGSATVSSVGGYSFPSGSKTFPKGGYGGFSGGHTPGSKYSSARTSHTNYRQTYNGGYTATSRSGWVGVYNPAIVYWTMMPAWAYAGYYYAYHRYNQDDGAYFAPELNASQGGGSVAILNGTENTSDESNYYYQFNMTTAYGYPQADHGYYATSDPEAEPADFRFRLAFAHVIEFDDLNQNGFYDESEESVVSSVPLSIASWSPFNVTLRQDTVNNSLSYYQFSTTGANLRVNGQPFSVDLTWRSTNVQINMTEGVPLQPNALQYNLTLVDYPLPRNGIRRLAIVQVWTAPFGKQSKFSPDVNITTPIDIANQIKTNRTYGISIGEFNEGRLEYETSVNITHVLDPPESFANIPNDTNMNPWMWRNDFSERYHRLLYISLPLINGTSPRLSGFSFLDINVLSAYADEYYRSAAMPSETAASLLAGIATLSALYALL
ncbi:hypothetical protein BJV82DRAFT_631655 [Fennellomyces sp. T-0311]|nr:hypothetical protein BJV82DRAFT_631655 [Fennellomyces sp. T-0311]